MTAPLIHGMSRQEIMDAITAMGQPSFRAGQIWTWLYTQLVADWNAMLNLPAALRAQLAEHFCITPAVARRESAGGDKTVKMLVELPDGESVEEVLIPAGERRTVCLSCQVGCKFHCAFCASGQAGFHRNLEAGEMVGQILLACHAYGSRPTNVVFMGIGEPMDNYDAVLKSIRILNDDEGLNIGARRITISTCGVISGIDRLAREGLQVELSVSLHAADEALRSRLMPVNRRFALDELLLACRRYAESTGRIVTFEYTLIARVNDSRQQAEELARRVKLLPCRVNLIPLSPVAEFPFQPTTDESAAMFMDVLRRHGINATLRISKGRALQAACGQLRYRRDHRTNEERD